MVTFKVNAIKRESLMMVQNWWTIYVMYSL